jgi:spermidine synthase
VPIELVLSLIVFVSGAAGLIFEILWFYSCGLVLGSSVPAATAVLSSFMGGLALGSGLAGWHAHRIRRPLRFYGAAEIVVAIAGVAVVHLLPAFTALIVPLAHVAGDRVWLEHAIRFGAAFAALIVPATAMGVTLPLLVDALSRQRAAFGVSLGRLYGWNTLGAVCGSLGAEVVFIERFGVTGSAWCAGLLDLGAGAGALWLSRQGTAQPAPDPPESTRPAPTNPLGAITSPRRLLAAAALAGGVLLALEVVWFRFLSMYVLTTTLAMSMMLAVVLAAIGAGGLVAATWLRFSARAAGFLPALSLAAGCAVIASYVSFQSVTHGTQLSDWRQVLWCAVALTFATSFLSGIIFTLIGDALARTIRIERRAAGWLMVANTAGAMCGPPLASFVLLPVLGMERAFFALAIVYAGIAVLAVMARVPHAPPRPRWTSALAGIALIVALAGFPFGLMRGEYFERVAAAYEGDGSAIVAAREGPSETILLMQQTWAGQPVYSRLVTNGFSMSGTGVPGMRYMRDFVYLPMLLHKAPLRRVLVICYGVGVTAGAAVDLPSVESIDIVEISRDVVAMSDVIYPSNANPLHDARARLHLEDGRYFLETTSTTFDLITGEPPPPRTPGAVNIYTREYFQLISRRLAEGGMATYWIPVGRPNPGTDVDTIIRAFCDVFDDCSLWNATPFDLMLLGTRQAEGPISKDAFDRAWRPSTLASHLKEIGFESPSQIGATFLGDSDYLRDLTSGTPALTDDYPQRLRPTAARVSLSDPRYGRDPAVAERYQRVIDPARARQAFATSAFIRRVFPAALISETQPLFDEQRLINRVLWEGGSPLRLIEDLDRLLERTSLRVLPLWMLGSDDIKQRIAAGADEGTGATDYLRGAERLVARDYSGAAAAFARSEARGLRAPTVRAMFVYSLTQGGRLDAAARAAEGIEPRGPDEVHFWNWMRAKIASRAR